MAGKKLKQPIEEEKKETKKTVATKSPTKKQSKSQPPPKAQTRRQKIIKEEEDEQVPEQEIVKQVNKIEKGRKKVVAKEIIPAAPLESSEKANNLLKRVKSEDKSSDKNKVIAQKQQAAADKPITEPQKPHVPQIQQIQVKKEDRQAKSFERPVNQAPKGGFSFLELNKLVGSLLNPSAAVGQNFNQNFKFTPRIDKGIAHKSIERQQQGIFLEQDSLQLKRRQSMEESLHLSVQSHQNEQPNNNLFAQAIQDGPQKQINRQEAMARAGIIKGGPGSTQANQQSEKKSMVSMAAIGGIIGGNQKNQFGIGFGTSKMSKQEMMQEKEQKNKKALQENSLVQFAANQPDLYAPITLPFFNKYNKDEDAPKLNKMESSKVIEQEQTSTIKLQRVESFKDEGDVSDLLVDKVTGSTIVSDQEPFLIQLPSTLPFQFMNFNQSNKQTNAIEQMIENLSLSDRYNNEQMESNESPSIGKLRIMKSGKVILRLQDPYDPTKSIDYEMIKGIQTNFYQEIISVDSQNDKACFMAPVNNKLIAVPDLDSIFD